MVRQESQKLPDHRLKSFTIGNIKEQTSVECRQTTLLFWSIVFFFASQSWMIPLVPVGGNYTIWPNLTDISLVCVGLCLFAKLLLGRFSWQTDGLNFKHYLLICGGSLVSFGMAWFFPEIMMISGDLTANYAIYQFYRLFQTALIMWACCCIPLTPRRVHILRTAVGAALLISGGSVLATFFHLVDTWWLVAHLPNSYDISGEWERYYLYNFPGWGAIGYNHSYTACHITTLLALHRSLKADNNGTWDLSLMAFSLVAIFASGSRSGLAGIVVMIASISIKKPSIIIGSLVILFLMPIIYTTLPVEVREIVDHQIERHSTTLEFDDSSNEQTRMEKWTLQVNYLSRYPERWMIGTGFGMFFEASGYSHNQFLHIVLETGLMGFVWWLFFVVMILKTIYRYDSSSRPFFWATMGLLVSSISQETFHPVPAMINFLSLYMASVCLIENRGRNMLTEVSTKPSIIRGKRIKKAQMQKNKFPVLVTSQSMKQVNQ